jgi:hypothetical protein
MGCTQSKDDSAAGPALKYKAQGRPSGDLRRSLTSFLPKTGPMTAVQYKERLESSESVQTMTLPHSKMGIKYAWVSQRGFYPSDLTKPNQDALCVHTCFNNNREDHLFGVFDGHGDWGTETAQYAREKASADRWPDPWCTSGRLAAADQRELAARPCLQRPPWGCSSRPHQSGGPTPRPGQPSALAPPALPAWATVGTAPVPPSATARCASPPAQPCLTLAPAPAALLPQVPENMRANPHLATSPALAFHQAMVTTSQPASLPACPPARLPPCAAPQHTSRGRSAAPGWPWQPGA